MGKETKEKGKHRGKKITQFPTQLDVQEELGMWQWIVS